MKKIVILILFAILSINAFACSMFTKTVDGKTLVGNNEDWKDPDPVIWVQPGEGEKFDCMYVGFDDYFPQGGMNEKGLCFDGFATEFKQVTKSMDKPEFAGLLNKHIMETCATIDEVIAEFDKYNLQSLGPAMLMFVDRSGDSVIIEGDEYIRKTGDSQIVTNFYQSEVKDGEKANCPRYGILLENLPETGVTIKDFTQVLASVHQEGNFPTQYTNIFDPDKLEMYLYRFHDYSSYLTFDLKEEVRKGRQVIAMKDVFLELFAYERFVLQQSRTFAVELYNIIEEEGLETAMKSYPELLTKKKTLYDFPLDEFEMNDMGYYYLMNGKIDEALIFFKINVEKFPDSWNCYDSLGEAYLRAGQTKLAIENYERSVKLNQENEHGREMLKELKEK